MNVAASDAPVRLAPSAGGLGEGGARLSPSAGGLGEGGACKCALCCASVAAMSAVSLGIFESRLCRCARAALIWSLAEFVNVSALVS